MGGSTIYVELEDEGVQVWRPVDARRVGQYLYRLPDSAPGGETWAFPPGSVVVAEERALAEGPALVAVRVHDPRGDLERALRSNPEDRDARSRLIEMLTNGIDYAMHEVPYGVIDDNPETLLPDIELLGELLDAEGRRAEYAATLDEWRFLAEAWLEYLQWEHRGPGKFAEFLEARGWQSST